jgi:hypothetical protein
MLGSYRGCGLNGNFSLMLSLMRHGSPRTLCRPVDLNGKAPAKSAEGGFQLIQARFVAQIEQAVDLGNREIGDSMK